MGVYLGGGGGGGKFTITEDLAGSVEKSLGMAYSREVFVSEMKNNKYLAITPILGTFVYI